MKSEWDGFLSALAADIERFVAHKRALRRRYDNEEKALRLLDSFLLERAVQSVEEITPDLLEAFLVSRPRTQPRSFNHLLGVVRRLFDWMVAQGRLNRSPLRTSRRRETARRLPHLFDAAQARRLLELAGSLPDNSRAPLRGATYRTIFALLYGLGLRVGEVSRLQHRDVDLERNLLVVRGTKFGKDRLVPFGPRMAGLLRDYLALRGAKQEPGSAAAVFSFTRKRPVHPGTISQTFHQLVPELNLSLPPGVAPPRLHDLRHSFAVGTLLRWYRTGVDPVTRLFHLSTFLGHVNPSSTAVYLSITTQLLEQANRRFEESAGRALSEVLR